MCKLGGRELLVQKSMEGLWVKFFELVVLNDNKGCLGKGWILDEMK